VSHPIWCSEVRRGAGHTSGSGREVVDLFRVSLPARSSGAAARIRARRGRAQSILAVARHRPSKEAAADRPRKQHNARDKTYDDP